MVERKEGSFKGHNGSELFYQTWTPTGPIRGTLVVTHGMSEHSEAYHRFASGLAPLGWHIIAWDLRGHGRSEGKRGYVENFSFYSFDLHHLIQNLRVSDNLNDPFVLVGHSMGGLISLRYILDHGESAARALCLSSPQLGIALKVPVLKDLAARTLLRFVPSVTLYNEIMYENLSRDAEVLKTYPLDALRHDKISPGVYLGMLENIALVKTNAEKITLPVLMQLAGDERIVSRPESEGFFKRLPSPKKKLIVYENSLHEIYNDLDRERAFADLNQYLKETLGL